MSLLKTTRRRMMLGLAAAATTASASATRAEAMECPDLMALADQLDGAVTRYKDAAQTVVDVAETWGPQWPDAPEETRVFLAEAEPERDILGAGIQRPWGLSPGLTDVPQIGLPSGFETGIKKHQARIAHIMTTKSKRGLKSEQAWLERMETALPLSKQYWAEVDRIKTASGIEAAQHSKQVAIRDLKTLVGQIVLHREKAITGLLIKAQALQAWSAAPAIHQDLNEETPVWNAALVATIERQCGENA